MWMEELDNGKFKYVERYTDPMTEKYKKVSVTLNSDSRVAWNKAQRELNTKIDKKLKTVNRSDVTFGEMLTKWHEVYKHTVKGSTYIRSKHTMRIVKRYIPDDYLIRAIDAAFIQETLESIYYKENYSYSSTKHCKAMISSVMNYSKKRKIIKVNPVLEVELKKKPPTIDQIEKIENKYLEPDELEKVISTQRNFSHGKRNSDLTEFLSLTGLRYGEAIALKEHNFKGSYIEVYGTLDYHASKSSEGVVTATKTAKGTRKVDLSARAVEILNEVISENHIMRNEDNFIDKNFIFVSINGNPISISTFNESLRNVEKKIGINKRISSHILRHTHISILAELGIPLKAIMDRVGHAKPETTLKIYTHVTEKMKSNIIDSLNDYEK